MELTSFLVDGVVEFQEQSPVSEANGFSPFGDIVPEVERSGRRERWVFVGGAFLLPRQL